MELKFFFITICLAFMVSRVKCVDSLKLVNLFYRHGARSPSNTYPTDPHKDSWPQGLDQLTTVGMQQSYDLGTFLKTLYIDTGFLDSVFNVNEIYVRSTDLDRTMMTGQCVLTAMYPPGLSQDQNFNTALNWQPISVHTVNIEDDVFLNMDTPSCPKYDKLQSDFYQTEEFRVFNASYEELYVYLKENSGTTKVMGPSAAWDVYDSYLCEITNGLTPPAWNTEEAMNTIVTELIPFQYVVDFGTVDKARLKGGVMVDTVINNMQAAINGELVNSTKMFMYSAHDDNVILLLMALNLYQYTYITYTSTIFFELYESPDGHKVKILYKNMSYTEPSTLTIPGCVEMCPIDDFIRLVSPYRVTPEQRLELCVLDEQSKSGMYLGIAVGVVLVLVLVVSVGCLIYRQKRGSVTLNHTNGSPARNEGVSLMQDPPSTSYRAT